ncbi:hypothetical protein [Pollutimonas bauzanensis]|uniref:MMPL family transporter n=1 Tax=Pollutimonas bauzanensis TaxID=658167 RepID=UPI00333E37FA
MPSPTERWLPRIFLVLLMMLAVAVAWQSRNGLPISSNLLDLLPHTQMDALTARAEERIQEPLSQQLVALAGNADPAVAVHDAQLMARRWQESGLFSSVDVYVKANIPALRTQLLALRISALPAADSDLLQHDPVAFVARRAREIMDPFSSTSLVPMSQDWLGLAKRTEAALAATGGTVAYDLASDTLQAQALDKTWVLIRAQTKGDAFDHTTPLRIGAMLEADRHQLHTAQTELLATGGMLYAAAARKQAMQESGWMGMGSVIGILLVLLATLRRPRALLGLTPVAVGMLTGFVACVAIFGSIHVLTLVVGASLIGVAVDYPMHWLGKSYGMPQWQAWPALRRVRAGMTLSLATSLIGYLALALTPFPALTQSAVFSVAGLLGAYACTVCLLPAWFKDWRPAPCAILLRGAQALLRMLEKATAQRMLIRLGFLATAAICAAGIARVNLHDDLRQWFSLPQALANDAQQIGKITGFTPTSQFFLVRAPNIDMLLERQEKLTLHLDQLIQGGKLDSYAALSQLAAPLSRQDELRHALSRLSVDDHALEALSALGIPEHDLKAHLSQLAATPATTLPTALASSVGERWRPLWLGEVDGVVGGMITLQGLRDVHPLQAIADSVPDTTLVDRTGELNTMFSGTRIEAAELKLASYVLAGMLLWFFLGRSAAWRILAVPLAATVCSLALLGYLGQPLTLFSLFGLLLVTAIGVDYAIFMYEQVAGAAASLVGIALGGATTLLSFGLLALSSTPAVSSFGLAVTVGVMFSLLWAPWVRTSRLNKDSYATT